MLVLVGCLFPHTVVLSPHPRKLCHVLIAQNVIGLIIVFVLLVVMYVVLNMNHAQHNQDTRRSSMSHRPTVENYYQALNLLGSRASRKLCNHTYLQKRRDNNIAVMLWSTDVVTFYPNGDTELRTGGWSSVTTFDRINSFSECRVYSTKGTRTIQGKDGLDYIFESGMVIKADGTMDASPYYTIILERITGKRSSSKEEMLTIIEKLDKKAINKFLKRISIDDDSISILCLTRLTDTNNLKDSIKALSPEQLWLVWRRGTERMKELVEPRLTDLLHTLSLTILESMWNSCRRGWHGGQLKEFLAEHCPKDFLPLILSEGSYTSIIESRLKGQAA